MSEENKWDNFFFTGQYLRAKTTLADNEIFNDTGITEKYFLIGGNQLEMHILGNKEICEA
jgi:hypothetical protein